MTFYNANACGHHPELCDSKNVCHATDHHEIGACGEFCDGCIAPWMLED